MRRSPALLFLTCALLSAGLLGQALADCLIAFQAAFLRWALTMPCRYARTGALLQAAQQLRGPAAAWGHARGGALLRHSIRSLHQVIVRM